VPVTGVWGNWCGPGCGAGPACDDVDRCCCEHDNCYSKCGYHCCSCDIGIISCVASKIDPTTAKGRAAAEIFIAFTYKVAWRLCNPFCNPFCSGSCET
jgi:hypothetical protein